MEWGNEFLSSQRKEIEGLGFESAVGTLYMVVIQLSQALKKVCWPPGNCIFLVASGKTVTGQGWRVKCQQISGHMSQWENIDQ